MRKRVVKSPGAEEEDLLVEHLRMLAAIGAFASGQCGRNARRGRRRERGCSDGRPEGEGVGKGAAQLEGRRGRHWKRDDEGGVPEKRTTH